MRARKASIGKDPRNLARPWVVRWSESLEDGRRKRWGKSFTRQRDAEKFANRKTRELRGEIPAVEEPVLELVGGLGDTSLAVFKEIYLDRRRAEGLRPATLKLYRDHLHRLTKHFGDGRAIGTITSNEIAEFVTSQRVVLKEREGQSLSKSSRNAIVRDLKIVFAYAKTWGYVQSSPMAGVRQLKVNEDDRRGWHYLSPSEFRALLKHTENLGDRATYAIMYGCGLRSGEAYNLFPRDVDLSSRYVHVRPREGTPDVPPFKIKDHECRSIPIPEYVADIIEEWIEARPAGSPYLLIARERYGQIRERWRDMRKRGGQWENKWLVNNGIRNLRLRARRAEIDLTGPITMHGFRKCYGRNGARHLTADVLKAYMGHADIATTLKYYSKRTKDDDVRARWILDAMFKGEPAQDPTLSDVQSDVCTPNSANRKIG